MTWVLNRFSYKVKFKDIFLARGVTYLIMILNYPASQAAFAYYLKRRCKTPIFEALGIFLFIIFIDFVWITTLAFIGSFFQDYTINGINLGRMVRIFTVCAYFFVILWFAFWRGWSEIIFGKSLDSKFLKRQRKRRVFYIFEHAKILDYVYVAIMRIPIHLTIIISMYIVFMTFGVSIPFTKILGNIPLVFFIGTLPITPGGLGTTNMAMVELLHRHLRGSIFNSGLITPQDLILAATILWMFVNYLLKAITGTIYLRHVSKDLFSPISKGQEEKIERESAHIGGNM